MNGLASLPEWARTFAGRSPHPPRALARGDSGVHVLQLRANLSTAPGPDGLDRDIVLKHFTRLTLGRTAVAAMRGIALSLEASFGAPLRVPRVLDWRPDEGVLVQSVAQGQPLLPLLHSPRRAEVLAAVARALACLHALPVHVGRVAGVDDHLRDLIRPRPDVVCAGLPGLGARLERVVAAVRTAGQAREGRVPSCPIHRDAHPRQMFFGGGCVSIVDWDLFARGDPALDVANFAVYLRTHLGRAGVSAAERFLSEYGSLNDTILPRVHLFSALTYVRLACKAYRLREPGWELRARSSVRRAEAALDRGAQF